MDAGSNAAITLLIICAVLYMLPWLLAAARGHSNALAIFVMNLLLGWTAAGWIIALVWAFTGSPATSVDRRKRRPCPQCAEMILADAKKCRHCGSAV